MSVIYRRTGAQGLVSEIKPDPAWPNHTLRVEFDSGAGFTFHRAVLWDLFERPTI